MKVLKDINAVEETLRRMDKLRQKVRKLSAELSEDKEAVRAYMEDAQLSTFSTPDGCTVTISKGTKTRFNQSAFAAEYPRIYRKFLEDEEYNQLYFKVR